LFKEETLGINLFGYLFCLFLLGLLLFMLLSIRLMYEVRRSSIFCPRFVSAVSLAPRTWSPNTIVKNPGPEHQLEIRENGWVTRISFDAG